MTEFPCKYPPPGWRCTRDEGHDGPCAAHPDPDPRDAEIERLRSLLDDWQANAPRPSVLDDLSASRAEIERLRFELKAAQNTIEIDDAVIERLRGEYEHWHEQAGVEHARCIAIERANERLRDALRRILAISSDRERFVMRGALGWAEAECIAREALGENF